MLDAVSDGPIMLVKVPAGKYAVTAMKDGKTLHQAVQVNEKGERQMLFHRRLSERVGPPLANAL